MLQSKEEQARLINEVPKVIAEVIEIKPESDETPQNNGSKTVSSLIPGETSEGNGSMPE